MEFRPCYWDFELRLSDTVHIHTPTTQTTPTVQKSSTPRIWSIKGALRGLQRGLRASPWRRLEGGVKLEAFSAEGGFKGAWRAWRGLHVLKVLHNGLLRYILFTCPKLMQLMFKCYGMDCLGTYFTHAKPNVTRWSLLKVKPSSTFRPSSSPLFAPRPFKPPWRGLVKGVPRNQPRLLVASL